MPNSEHSSPDQERAAKASIKALNTLLDDPLLCQNVVAAMTVAEELKSYARQIKQKLSELTGIDDWAEAKSEIINGTMTNSQIAKCVELVSHIDFVLETPADTTWFAWWPKMTFVIMGADNLFADAVEQAGIHNIAATAFNNIKSQSVHNASLHQNNLEAVLTAYMTLVADGQKKPSGSRIAKELNDKGTVIAKRTAEACLKELKEAGKIHY